MGEFMGDSITIRIRHDGQIIESVMQAGMTPFEAIRTAVPDFGHACGGNGTCGKCRIRIEPSCGDACSAPADAEIHLLGQEAVGEGHRLACLVRLTDSADLQVETRERKAKIAAESVFRMPAPSPVVRRVSVQVPAPSLGDQRADASRLADALQQVAAIKGGKGGDEALQRTPAVKNGQDGDAATTGAPLDAMAVMPADARRRFADLAGEGAAMLLHRLPGLLRASEGQVTAVLHQGHVRGLLGGDRTACSAGIACDIGTTTLAGSLVDLSNGAVLATETLLNGQKRFGADVISRIRHTMEREDGAAQLRNIILADLRTLGLRLCDTAGVDPDTVDEWVLTGNTTMGHLLMGWPPAAIAAAPFIPVSVDETVVAARTLWPDAPEHASVALLSGVSAYVGADTVSAVLACGLDHADAPALVVDLGTNGELVLGDRNGLLACSTAAGPAFEGAGIRFGMGAVEGAIDSVSCSDGIGGGLDLAFTVLGGGQAEGLCGTGLLDAVSALLETGLIDETGRIQDGDDLPDDFPPALLARLAECDGQAAVCLVPGRQTAHGRDILLTQRDIREFQNAKAAVAAGIATLADVAGIGLADIAAVHLAGGLGTWLNPDSAIRTGLIPAELAGRIRPVGNAALAGAMSCLLSGDLRARGRNTARTMRFVELSGRRDFNDRYVDAMLFGEA